MTVPMSVVEDIRLLDSQGVPWRQIATRLGVSRDSVAKYAQMEDLSAVPVRRAPGRGGGVLSGHEAFIDQVLEADKHAPRKQRHTVKRLFDRLVTERGYAGSYRTVCKYVARWRQARQSDAQAFAELEWAPASAQVDFGQVQVVDGFGNEVTLAMLVLTLPFSNARYAQLYRGENAECVCHGLATIFGYLGFVPSRIVFDNATGIGRRFGKVIEESALFRSFRAHHRFTSVFCNPYSGNEKGNVENAVGFIRRNFLVPVPQVVDIDQFNRDFLVRCDGLGEQPHYRKGLLIRDLLVTDRSEGIPLPRTEFTAARVETRIADKEGRVKIGGTLYLASPALHGLQVTVSIHHDHIDFFDPEGLQVRSLPRDYSNSATTITHSAPLLSLLATKPGAWTESPLRSHMPTDLVMYLDKAPYDGRKRALVQMNRAVDAGCEIETVTSAALKLIERGDQIEEGPLTLLANRVPGTHEENPAVNLKIYDALTSGAMRSTRP